MHLYQYLALVARISSVTSTAFMIPEGQGDGVYAGHFDQDGEAVTIKLADLVPRPRQRIREVDPLLQSNENFHTHCYRVTINKNDIGTAAFNLGQTCDHKDTKVRPQNFLYSVAGDAAVYVCNPDKAFNEGCSSKSINSWIATVERHCPVGRGGYVEDDGKIPFTIGITEIHKDICSNYRDVPHGPAEFAAGRANPQFEQ